MSCWSNDGAQDPSAMLKGAAAASQSIQTLPDDPFPNGTERKVLRDPIQYLLRGLNPHTPPTLILDPIVARQFIDRDGFDTEEKLIQWIHDHATMPAGKPRHSFTRATLWSDSLTPYLKPKICFQIFSYLANSRYSFSPKP